MTRLVLTLLFAFALPVLAGDSPDVFLEKQGGARDRWQTVLLAECMGIENGEVRKLLQDMRQGGELPPFSEVWCVKRNHATRARILKDGIEH